MPVTVRLLPYFRVRYAGMGPATVNGGNMTGQGAVRRRLGGQQWTATAAAVVVALCGIAITPQGAYAALPSSAALANAVRGDAVVNDVQDTATPRLRKHGAFNAVQGNGR